MKPIILFGACAVASGVALAVVAHPTTDAPHVWTNTPGLRPEADACHEEQCMCFDWHPDRTGGGTERLCVTDAELGLLVRRTGVLCDSPDCQRSLKVAIEQLKEERRLHGIPQQGK